MTVRNWLTKLIRKSNKVEQAFFVTERDKGDYNNLHVHMIIGTNTDMSYQEVRHGLGNVSVGDYQPIYDSEQVCKYVTKHIGKDCLLYTSPSPRDRQKSRMPSSA